MTRRIIQIRNLIVGLLIGESVLLFGLYLLINHSMLFAFAVYALVKNIILFIIFAYLSYLLETNNMSVSEALNIDAKNALIFGGIALIQYDETRNVVWTSDLFKEMNINIVGVKLLEWQPHLASLFDDEDIKVIDIKGKRFEAYNSKETKLIYLKDVTQFLSLQQDYLDQQVCMAYITIDNYEETLENADEPKMALIQSKSRQVIVDWAYSNGIIIRRFKSGGYLAFFNERIYKKQVENKFAILDTFKEMSRELDEVMTLSIGIGRDSRVLRELDDMASNALNLTYSRGGDQVAVKSGDDNVKFFGGNSDTFEKSSKVRARVIAQSLAGLIKNSGLVLVMGHKNSDLDSFGASLGVAKIAKAYGKKTNIVLDFDSIEQKTKNVANLVKSDERYKGLIVSYTEAMERIGKNTLLIIVDNHKPSLAISNALLERVKNKVIIDHHRRGEEFIEAPVLTYLEPAASSTVELVVELCDYQNTEVDMNELDATIMYAGMLVDTNNFKQRVGVRTFQSAAYLKELQANVTQAYEFLEDSYEETLKKLSVTQRSYQYNPYILISCGEENEDYTRAMLSKASNSLLEVSGIKASFTIGRVSKSVVAISARSAKDINVQIIMENMGGGGHFSMAAAQFENQSIEDVRLLLEEKIKEYLDDRGEV
ncbi:DHH family phosphoesterase [Candidatus Stoquefichus sp. SB1]|jgi:c-di-AMP phosphodiesterase-like protein|uniref:DHH family phosphoesterase n=1 Tax=Candidatus Stoquefichus sp. SB1 TaxID=1658109 RepID=UPI00067ED8CE|nr:DHH family phosphoesterase [Candidatus Stoquefichus sp. SB1]